jgi:hypothetical protein
VAENAETVLRTFRAAAVERQLAHRKRQAAAGLTRCTLMVPTTRHAEMLAIAKRMRVEHRARLT